MNRSNKGAYLIDKNLSIGITMPNLENEQEQSPYILKENIKMFDTFAERKKELMHNNDCNIFFPGGMGTLDEFTDILNLYKTDCLDVKNIYLVGEKYWNSLKEWFRFNLIKWPEKFINIITDDIDDILEDLNFISKDKKNSLVLFDNNNLNNKFNNNTLSDLFDNKKNDNSNSLKELKDLTSINKMLDDMINTLYNNNLNDITDDSLSEPLLSDRNYDDSDTSSNSENNDNTKKSRFTITTIDNNDYNDDENLMVIDLDSIEDSKSEDTKSENSN